MQRAVPTTPTSGRGAARRTCVCIAAPVITDRSDVRRAVCDPTTSAAFQRWRTARTHRTRVLCTTDRKQNRSSAERSRRSASKAKANLAVVPIAFGRPHAEASGTDCALPTIGKVDLESAAWHIARLTSAHATAFPRFLQRKRPIASAPHLRARRASLPAPVPASLGTLHPPAVRPDVRSR